MRRGILIVLLCALLSTSSKQVPTGLTEKCGRRLNEVEPGDLVFIRTRNGLWDGVASAASGKKYGFGHVGIVVAPEDSSVILVAHARGNPISSESGVIAEPIQKFAGNASRIGIFRAINVSLARALSVEGKKIASEDIQFDDDFVLNNNKLYCTELVWVILRDFLGRDPFLQKEVVFGREIIALRDLEEFKGFKLVFNGPSECILTPDIRIASSG